MTDAEIINEGLEVPSYEDLDLIADPVAPIAGDTRTVYQTLVQNAFENRIGKCISTGNKVQQKKWELEQRAFMSPAMAEKLMHTMGTLGTLDNLAIYAAQKVRKLVAFSMGAGRLDDYTKVIIENAYHLHAVRRPFRGKLQAASMSRGVIDDNSATLERRKASTVGTASTQASSTRQALKALNLAHIEGMRNDGELVVHWESELMQEIIKRMGLVSEEEEALAA